MHWITKYLNKPWVSGGRGPEAFDCWGLVAWIQKEHYGRELEPYNGVDAHDWRRVAVLIDGASHQSEWQKIDKPVDGCIVAMAQGRIFHHVGVFLEMDGGYVLHAAKGQPVVAQRVHILRQLGWRRIEFYLRTSWPSSPA